MIDINRIRNNKEEIELALLKRMDNVKLDTLLKWDKEKREIGTYTDELRARRRKKSEKIAVLKKENKQADALIAEMTELGKKIEEYTTKYNELDKKEDDYLAYLPNIPDDDIPAGGKENNMIIKEYLQKPVFNYNLIPHFEILKRYKMVDYDRGIKIAGEKSWIYTGLGARLEWALINYFIDTHIKNGYTFTMLPYVLNYECGYGAGQFPKFKDEVYTVGNTDKFLLPTAETALVNLHSNEILNECELPKKYFAYTQCFRVEAGSSRVEERGTIRGHQFNKVEMVQYVKEDKTEEAFNELLNIAEGLMKKLGLHYRVSKLAAADCAQAMCRTYDIEVWIPSMNKYIEVSSVSNSRDYQARRNHTKYRDANGKTHYVCTLNASGLATSRLLPAIVEQFQNEDGSITIPEVLRPYLDGIDIIK